MRKKPRHCPPRPRPRPAPWDALRKEVHAVKLKVAAVAIRGVTILHEQRALADVAGDTLEELRALAKDFRPEKPKGWFDYRIGLVQLKTKGKDMLNVSLENTQQINITLTPRTLKGKPAKIDGKPEWSVESGDSTCTVADDGLSALLVTSDAIGDTVFLVTADVDLGEGIKTIEDRITLSVTEAQAATLGFTLGEPQDKPEAAPAGGGDAPAKKSGGKKR